MFYRTLFALVALLGLSQAAEVTKGVAARNVSTFRFQSNSLNADRVVNVILPMDYQQSTRRYPALYLLHGLGDDQSAWAFMTNVSAYASRFGIIIVMPDAGRSWYVNSAADPAAKYEDMIVKDLIPYVDSNYRTIPLRRARAVAGLSMGGYGAMFLGLKHSNRFAAIGAFSGALAISHGNPAPVPPTATAEARKRSEEMNALFGPADSAARKERDPFELLDKVPAGQMPLLYIACGGQDFLLKHNRDFVDLLATKKVPYEYREISPRVHSWDFWDDQIDIFLGILAHMPGFPMAQPHPMPPQPMPQPMPQN
ncbi:alpha/beta hydrolase family protein [uncultured Paludibaculum sp.]|uniref:alpha/beta hydrolase n=1 Tax=uncultured Paludibaculum sp. TaxID=1765020 RepID=UPI002AABB03E|nr:alpha/beta hydrolase family protein [uncultured Paludibaculum sp.]